MRYLKYGPDYSGPFVLTIKPGVCSRSSLQGYHKHLDHADVRMPEEWFLPRIGTETLETAEAMKQVSESDRDSIKQIKPKNCA